MTQSSYEWTPYRPTPPQQPLDWWVKGVPVLVGGQYLIAGLLWATPPGTLALVQRPFGPHRAGIHFADWGVAVIAPMETRY